MNEEQITVAINAGLALFADDSETVLPYSDGMFFLKQLLLRLDAGQYALLPMTQNAEGNMTPAPGNSA